MTSLQPSTSSGGDVVQWSGETGLEDFDTSDLTMPRLVIDHAENKLKNTQTDELFEDLDVVLLGLHKSRIMWGDINDGDDNDPPLCKSPDTKHGFPCVDPELAASKRFPWSAQDVYTPADMKPLEVGENLLTMPSIGCKQCHFKEWNTDPTGKRPWCSEEWTFPLLYQDPNDPESWVPALFTIKRSGLKPARGYVTTFATKNTPIFTVVTKLGLDANRRGMVKYSTPTFTKIARTHPDSYQDYFESFQSAKQFLLQFPMPKDDDEAAPEDDGTLDEPIQGNIIDAEVETQPEPVQPTPQPHAARAQPEPVQPKPPVVEEEPPMVSTKGKVKPIVTDAAPAAGTVQIDDDEEPPF